MDARTAISVQGAGKRYRLQRNPTRTLKSEALSLLRGQWSQRRDFWALRDVSFSVARGETLGIIGANGAGKSTLLGLLAGTRQPTEGAISVNGAVSSLLELGAGFHPDLTGRENVFLFGAIMGLSRRRMVERFDAVVEFAELREFIDQPVKYYSSGMYVRLGFAVAVEVDPDIMLIDEVLSVGDAAFQRKCVERMARFREAGKTMLVISHDLATIKSISDRILFLDAGRVKGIGSPDDVVTAYELHARRETVRGMRREWGTGEAVIAGVTVSDGAGRESSAFRSGDAVRVVLRYRAARRIADPVFGFAISDRQGRVVYGNNTQIEGARLAAIEGEGSVAFEIAPLALARGAYLLSFSIHSADHKTNYHRLDNAEAISVESDKPFEGVYLPCKWTVPRLPPAPPGGGQP